MTQVYVPPTAGIVDRTQWRWEEATTLAENTSKRQAGDQTIPVKLCFPKRPKYDPWVIGAYEFLVAKSHIHPDDDDESRERYRTMLEEALAIESQNRAETLPNCGPSADPPKDILKSENPTST